MRLLKNKKADGEEIGMGMAAIALVVVMAMLAYSNFVVFHGHAVKQSEVPVAESAYILSTSSYLSNLLIMHDEYGTKYSTLIVHAIDSPDKVYTNPSKITNSNYYVNTIKPKICEWLDINLGQTYYFYIDAGSGGKFSCGTSTQALTSNYYIDTQELPSSSGNRIKAVLVTWPL